MVQDTSERDDDQEAWATASHRADIIRSLLEGDIGRLEEEAVAAAASGLGLIPADTLEAVSINGFSSPSRLVSPGCTLLVPLVFRRRAAETKLGTRRAKLP
jgi:hypothetical protein